MGFGASTCRSVEPLWPFCPPGGLPDGSRRLRVRGSRFGLCNPSLDGGLPLLELFSPSRRSNSATRASNMATVSWSIVFSARRRPRSSKPATGTAAASGARVVRAASSTRVMDRVTHMASPAATGFLERPTWAVTENPSFPRNTLKNRARVQSSRCLSHQNHLIVVVVPAGRHRSGSGVPLVIQHDAVIDIGSAQVLVFDRFGEFHDNIVTRFAGVHRLRPGRYTGAVGLTVEHVVVEERHKAGIIQGAVLLLEL